VVGILKSISASRAFDKFPERRRKFWSGELWEDGYAARTVGDKVTSDLIRRHIKRRAVDQAPSGRSSSERRLPKPRPLGGEGHFRPISWAMARSR